MFELTTLHEYWNPLTERCGLILRDETILEIPNKHENPANGFSFPRSYFDQNPGALATWHTHPTGNPNLSYEDYKIFLSQPKLFHYIVGDGIVWGFYVRNNKVFLYEDAGVSGVPEQALP